MKYFVKHSNGKTFGPCYKSTLNEWAKEGRIIPDTDIVNENGETFKAEKIIDFFPTSHDIENNSGEGKDCIVPKNIKGLNFGAFALSFIWGPVNKIPLGYLSLFLSVINYLIMGFMLILYFEKTNIDIKNILFKIHIILGAFVYYIGLYFLFKGNELAWQNRRFKSKSDFQETQRVWLTYGIIVFIISILCSITVF